MADTVVDFLLENLERLQCHNFDLILAENQIEALYEDLKIVRAFLKDSEEICNEHEEVRNLVTQIRDVACEALDVTDMAGQSGHAFDCSPKLRLFIEDIKSIKKEVMEIRDKKLYGVGDPQVGIPSVGSSSTAKSSNPEQETVVGFDEVSTTILDRLTGGEKQLEVISIVGMAGHGKTTLAKKVYNHGLIEHRFYIRAWIVVSEVYCKRDLLLDILESANIHLTGKIEKMSDEKLGEELYKGLIKKRYLIVMDDMWSIGAWDDLKRSFPNDNIGSRIIFTTRLKEVASQVSSHELMKCLPFLTKDESWDLLRQKIFQKESCPQELVKIGKEIASKCQGLPLAIVVVAGLLAKKDMTEDWWKQVAQSVSSKVVSETTQDILALSYKHLPHHLKACFLYFGAFRPDYEIPLWRLTWLWVAEGYIQQLGAKSLEDVAEEYLRDLIDRSLVLVAKKSSNGGIKACQIHDLLHELCKRKAKEKNFQQQVYWYDQISSFSSSSSSRRPPKMLLCFHSHGFHCCSSKPCAPHFQPFFSFNFEWSPHGHPQSRPFIYKILRVLDLWYIHMQNFPNEILQLLHLRYLALRPSRAYRLPESISSLWNLETLIFDAWGDVTIPHNIWKMVKLRHLRFTNKIKFEDASSSDAGCPSLLNNLKTMSTLHLSSSSQDVLGRTPNLKKLGLCMWGNIPFPNLGFLNHLETLKLYNNIPKSSCIPEWNMFLPNLKKLTLSHTGLEWKEISTIGRLPNLEVLKLLDGAFEGPLWDTNDGEFLKLKFLKFQGLKIAEWNASSDHFPSLERLVVYKCTRLKEIPFDLGDINTLEMIELYWPIRSTENSAKEIQKEQESVGNNWLKILIYPPNED